MLPDHTIFHETDTGKDFTLLAGVWLQKDLLTIEEPKEELLARGDISFLNITTPQLVTITSQSTPVAIAGGAWTSSNLEGLTVDVDGIATYTRLETKNFQVNFSALIEKIGGGATDIALTVLINGIDVTTNAPHSVNAGVIQISATRMFSLSTNDTLQLAVLNIGSTSNIEVSQANMSITN